MFMYLMFVNQGLLRALIYKQKQFNQGLVESLDL